MHHASALPASGQLCKLTAAGRIFIYRLHAAYCLLLATSLHLVMWRIGGLNLMCAACSGSDSVFHRPVRHPELCAQPQACRPPVVCQRGQQHPVVDLCQGLLARLFWHQVGQHPDLQDHAQGVFQVHEPVHWRSMDSHAVLPGPGCLVWCDLLSAVHLSAAQYLTSLLPSIVGI